MKILKQPKLKEGFASTDLHVDAYFNSEGAIKRALREAIIAEQDATNMYEKIVDGIESYMQNYKDNASVIAKIPDYEKIKEVVQDVANEEKVHVGEFTRLLKLLATDEQSFLDDGEKEVEDTMGVE
jgi:rubrerythrin